MNKAKFATLLELVESAYQYFSKDSILTGNYNQHAVLQVGLKVWRDYEEQLKQYRKDDADLLKLACFVARKL